MESAAGNCVICNRQLLESGQCLYCTTSEALNLRELKPDHMLSDPPADKMLTLVEIESGRAIPLTTARLRIGRDPKNQIIVDDLYVSRHHAFITYEDSRFWVEDLGSKNGTKLNGAHILDREVLNPGDTLTIGHAVFQVKDGK